MRDLRVGLPGGRTRDRLRRAGRAGRRGALARGAALEPSARTSSRGSAVRRASGSARPAWRASRRCPVGIEHVPTIVDMRRTLVERGDVDPLLQQTLQNFATQGNSYGKSARHARALDQGPGLQDPRRPQGAGGVRLVRRRLRLLRRARAARVATARQDPARRRRVVRAALRGRAQRGQRRAPGRRGGSVRDARRAEHGRLRRRAVRGDLHHRPALAEHAAQRVSAVRARQARLPLHRAARRPRRARAGSPCARRSRAHASPTTTRATWRATTGSPRRRAS